MKTILIVTAAFIVAATICCTSDTTENKTAETPAAPAVDSAAIKNLETVHLFNKAFETGDFSAIRAVLADDAIDHAGMNGDVKGGDSVLAEIQAMSKMMTDMKSTVIKELADKDYVFEWMQSSGKMAADGFGMKKGDTYSGDAIEVTRFNSDGKAAEHWTFMNSADMMKMMGSMGGGK
ncbi:MAG TPA: nuclear transport factor 2 family protein [Panacibacter sp.]|nr:nuclear transport factor 2 family protein [Panacibacter sp.]